MLKFFALLSFAVVVAAREGNFTNNGKEVDTKSGKLIDWYTCEAQGNYPDPTTCDHYIACTTALLAYQMPCQMGQSGRLWYVRDSGPVEADSYCDYPKNVDCDLAPTDATTPPPAITDPVTTTTTTSAPPTTPGGLLSCGLVKPGGIVTVTEGDDCNPIEDCKQCGDCGHYLVCLVDKWEKIGCDENEVNGTIKLDEKLFWRPSHSAADIGGVCSPWARLSNETRETYREDPNCKEICKVKADPEGNVRKYLYTDPNLDRGTWKAPAFEFCCEEGTQFDETREQCVLCTTGNDCTVPCP
ncbi:uncharacterized protein LOC110860146 [Folsomia candida]|uniref:uncharacterized protein LOC110860146 n=1 Tax=Folsomia candida TaxID=158441 RepID=UPI000B8F7763|nr:uncharacterized protein LOC110860146 [Folsomia candida]